MAHNDLKKLNVIVEDKIPFIRGVIEPYARVTYLANEDITPAAVARADALLVRTRTRCNADLLTGSKVRFVGTGTIGMDHIDTAWCRTQGITAVNAPGCNAPAVAQYVFASLAQVVNRPLRSYTLGIVGVGHVGSIVRDWARSLDMKVLLCDPPRQRREGGGEWSSLADIARQADIVTFHTPLTREGLDATWHLADMRFFESLRRAPIIVNAARGPVVDTRALIEAKDLGLTGPLVIDTWEGEPNPDRELLSRAAIATPHIAGYSRQGKIRATQMVLDAFAECFGLPRLQADAEPVPQPARSVRLTDVIRSYDPTADTAALKASPETFELQRDSYPLRAETPGRSED